MKLSILLLIAMLLAVALVPCEASHNRKLKSRNRHHMAQTTDDAASLRQQQLERLNQQKQSIVQFQTILQNYEAIIRDQDILKKQIEKIFSDYSRSIPDRLTWSEFNTAKNDLPQDPWTHTSTWYRFDDADTNNDNVLTQSEVLAGVLSYLNQQAQEHGQQFRQIQRYTKQLEDQLNSSQ